MFSTYPESPSRSEAEAAITRRLKISKWFTRTMFAIGLGSGLMLADLPAGSHPSDGQGLTILTAAAIAAPIEKWRAHKAAERTVTGFAISQNASTSGRYITKLEVKDGELCEEVAYDPRTYDSSAHIDVTIFNGVATVIGGIGSAMAARDRLSGAISEDAEATVATVGAILIGMGVFVIALDNQFTADKIKSCAQRLENIESDIRFEV